MASQKPAEKRCLTRALVFAMLYKSLKMRRFCGCHITAIISAFQAEDVGSTPIIRFYRTLPFCQFKLKSSMLMFSNFL